MKRAISLLVAIVMIISMIPNVFAASETATVLEDISEIAVSLNADNGYYAEYSWTPSEDGELSLYQYTEKDIEVMLTQGENTATNYSEVDGVASYGFSVSLEIVAGEEVTIEVINAVEEDQEFTVTGSFVGSVGKTQDNPIMLYSQMNTVTNTGTVWYGGYFSGMIMTVTGEGDFTVTHNGEELTAWFGELSTPVSSANPRMPVTFAITGEGQFSVNFTYPLGHMDNPAELYAGMANYATIEAGSQGYFYTWTAPAAGTLTLEFYAQDADWNALGWSYAINNMTAYTYGDTQWSDSDPVVNPAVTTVAAGELIQVCVNTYDPANMWATPAGEVCVTATFVCAEHGETAVEDAYDGETHNVKCVACGTVLSTEAHTYVDGVCECTAAQPGTEANPQDLTNDLLYDEDFEATVTVPAGTTYYCMAYRVGGMYMTINGGAEVLCETMGMFAPYTWTLVNEGTEAAEYVIKVSYPVGNQNNPEIVFRPNYISVNIAEGNDQGYFYKWTSNADGELKLTCPTVEGVAYDVTMTNMTTYAQAWLQDSTDGTITLAVSTGDEVIIQVAAIPDENWNYPALQTALTGEFIFPLGSMMNPEVITDMAWYCGTISQAEGDTDGYYYTYTAPADGDMVFYFGHNEGLENYVLDIIVTNQNTYAQKSLLNDGVDNYGMELQLSVKAGDVLVIQVVAIADAEGNYAPAVNEMSWWGNFAYPAGSEQNPISPEWTWNDEYTDATSTVTVAAGETVYYYGTAGMILTINGVVTEMDKAGTFSITNATEAEASYALALATPVGAYNNPENIEALPFEDANSLAEDGSYNYIWTATATGTVTLTISDGANLTVDKLTYSADSEWPISEQFALAEPEIDENWNYIGWIVADKLVIDVVAGQQLKIQVAGLTDWSDWTTPAIAYTLNAAFEPAYAITKQPEALNVDSGVDALFSVETKGEVASYQWQYRKAHKWFNTSMEGFNTATLTVAATGYRNGYDYRCMVTFADGTVLYSEPAELTVNTTITITYQPNDQLVSLGYKGQFTVKASGEGLKYQWQYSRPNSEVWSDTQMDGCTLETVMIETTTARDGYKYRCKITDAAGNVAYSDVATMTVLYYTVQPQDVRTGVDTIATFSVETNEEPVSYQWQYSRNGGESWSNTSMDGYDTPVLVVPATANRNGYQYRCVATGAKNSKLISNAVTLNVGEEAQITAQPESVTAAVGTTVSFTVEATNVYSYQWMYSKNGTDWYGTSMTGATTDTLQVAVTANRNGYQYRCKIIGTDGSMIYTDVATLTVG